MATPDKLLESNRNWAQQRTREDPGFFRRLAERQTPEYLWIGCSDSRVPANQIVDMLPGEIFVHRNIANQVQHGDLNCLSVIQYAVDVLKIKHIIVCGHYGCGGVAAAMNDRNDGLMDYWVWAIKLSYQQHLARMQDLSRDRLLRTLAEVNVIDQVHSLARTRIVQDAWSGRNPLTLHGWIYDIRDGVLHDVGVSADRDTDLEAGYRAAIDRAMPAA